MKRTGGDKICKMSARSVFYENTKKSHIVVIVVNHQSISIVEEASGDEVGIGKVSCAERQ